MDKKSKFFSFGFILLIIGSVVVTYYRYIVQRDYVIEARVGCDPHKETCFVHICDSTTGEECTGDPEKDTSYYKLIRRNAKNIPICDPKIEGCNALVCPNGEEDCAFTLCDPTKTGEGDRCS